MMRKSLKFAALVRNMAFDWLAAQQAANQKPCYKILYAANILDDKGITCW